MFKFLNNLFDSNEKQLQQIQPIVDQINDLEDEYTKLSDKQLTEKTKEFREKIGGDLDNA
ncbi:MAG: hypothetical protein XD93_0671, partial [candidate division WS6 bacterium 34_10]